VTGDIRKEIANMSTKQKILNTLRETGIIAVIRTEDPNDLVGAAKALCEGGVKLIEITLTVPGALKIIEEAVSQLKHDEVYIGAGTVLDSESARAVILAGGSFAVAPIFSQEMVSLCNRYGVLVMSGALTPQEIFNAWEGGSDVVKVFPASIGGPAYIKSVKEPLPQIELLPTNGVTLQNIPDFIKAGVIGVGVGRNLIGNDLIKARDYKQISENARTFIQAVQNAKAGIAR
jgi:2-dehydro-3-deoxyphosphogluconate aldolase/(4S)-4-hydroxy-2-oxoglutarate aldolase